MFAEPDLRFVPERLLRRGDYVFGSFVKPEQVDGYLNAANPGDRADVLGRFPFSLRSVDDAVDAAARGTKAWRRVGLMDRAAAIDRFKQQLRDAAIPLAQLLVRETGRPLWETTQEVSAAVRAVDLFLDDGLGLIAPRVMEDISGRSDYVPRGVIGLVQSSVLPVLHGVINSVAGVLGGNGVVFKPSKYGPGSGQALAEIWDRTKLPRGVFNLVQGPGAAVGQRLINHPGLDALIFTGSFDSAREVRKNLLERQELPVCYQTGGKGLAIVTEDAPRDRTVYELLVGAFLSSGQRPNSTARVFVHTKAWDNIVPELVRRAEQLHIGYGFDDDVFMGPLVSDTARSRYRRYCKAVTNKNHHPLLDGEVLELSGHRGHYVTPGIYQIDWSGGAPFLNEEPPGPILLLYRVRDLDEAVELHNRAVYRPVTSIFARPDSAVVAELRDSLKTGAINVNRATVGSSLRLPSAGQGRASSGWGGGIDLVRFVTYARASSVETRRFDPSQLVPGSSWHKNDAPTPYNPLELRVESGARR